MYNVIFQSTIELNSMDWYFSNQEGRPTFLSWLLHNYLLCEICNKRSLKEDFNYPQLKLPKPSQVPLLLVVSPQVQ